MSDQGTCVLEVSEKANVQSMTLNSADTPHLNGGIFPVKDHTSEILSDGNNPAKHDTIVVKKSSEEIQDEHADINSDIPNGGDVPVEKDCDKIIMNGHDNDIQSASEDVDKHESSMTNSDDPSSLSSVAKSSLSFIPSSLSPTPRNCDLSINYISPDKTGELPRHSTDTQSVNKSEKKLDGSPSTVNSDMKDKICEPGVQSPNSETTQKPSQSNESKILLDDKNFSSPSSSPNRKENEKHSSRPEHPFPAAVDQTSSCQNAVFESKEYQPSLDNFSSKTPHSTSTNKSFSENKSSEDQSSYTATSPSVKSPVEDGVLVSGESAESEDVMEDMKTNDAEQNVICQDSPEVSVVSCNSKDVGSRISLLEFNPGTGTSLPGTNKISKFISHSLNVDNNVLETPDEKGQAELMEEDLNQSGVLDKVEEPSCDVNMCFSDSVVLEVKDGVVGDAAEEMDQQTDALLDAENIDCVDKERDNSSGDLDDDRGDNLGPTFSISSVEGAKNDFSPSKNEQDSCDDAEIRLVSVCSVVDDGDGDLNLNNVGVGSNDGNNGGDGDVTVTPDNQDVNRSGDCINVNSGNKNDVESVNMNPEVVDGCDGDLNGDIEDTNRGDQIVNMHVEDVNGGDEDLNADVEDNNGSDKSANMNVEGVNEDNGDINTNVEDMNGGDKDVNREDLVVISGDKCLNKGDICVNNDDGNLNTAVNDGSCITKGSGERDAGDKVVFEEIPKSEACGNLDAPKAMALSDENSMDKMKVTSSNESSKSKENMPQSENSAHSKPIVKESLQGSVKVQSSSTGTSKVNVSEECLMMELESESAISKCDTDVENNDVITMDIDDENDAPMKNNETLSSGKVIDSDAPEKRIDETEGKNLPKVEDVKDEQTEVSKTDTTQLEDSKCPEPKKEDNKDVETMRDMTGSTEKTVEDNSKKICFKDILKSNKIEITVRKKEEMPPGDDVVIILDETDEDASSSKTTTNTTPVNEIKENSNNNCSTSHSESGNSSKTVEISRSANEVARKRSISSDENANSSSPKRSRLDSATKTVEKVDTKKVDDVTVILMDSDKEDDDTVMKETDKPKKPVKEGASPAVKPGMTLTSEVLRSYIMGSIKAAIWSHKLKKTIELEERMSKMEAASTLWKESGKQLEKSVEELTKFSKEIDKRKAESQKMKQAHSRSVGVQVTPISVPDNQRLPHQPTRQTTQQGRQTNQPVAPKQSSAPSNPTSSNTPHRLPPSVLLNHNGGGQKPVSVSPSGPTSTPTMARQSIRPQLQHQTGVRPQGNPITHYSPSNPEQNQGRQRYRLYHNMGYGPNNPPPPFNNHNSQPRPTTINHSPNASARPSGQSRLPSPAVNNSGVIDLTDEDDNSKRSNPQNNTFTNNPVPNNNMNRSKVANRGGNAPLTQQNQYRPPQSGVNSRTTNISQQQRHGGNNLPNPNAGPRPGYNNASKPVNGPTGLTRARINGVSDTRQTNNTDSNRANSSAKPSLPPSPSLHSKHPAPFPTEANSVSAPGNAKLKPPKPSLKISRVVKGIVLSWNMPPLTNTETVSSYQLYAYQESSGIPSSSCWKKVGDVKALPLPMACTLTQFQEGNKYHFAVRAVDKYGRFGEYSDPSSIYLHPERATNS